MSLSTAPTVIPPERVYDHVCLGGTFDSLHDGHKLLLDEALRRCKKSLTCGVTDKSMLKSKVLWELIAPVEQRIDGVLKYLNEKDSSKEYKVVEISDPFGPAILDETLECIVVSQETVRGGAKINEIRKEKKMRELDVVVIELVGECCKESAHEEDKISSSNARIRKLGTLLREPKLSPSKPYMIGFTGGIASGKSNIVAELEKLGAGIVDCDKIAHRTYEVDSPTYREILNEFSADGEITNASDSTIDRKKLGSIVFGNAEKLRKLESIVWPATRKLVAEQIAELTAQQKKVIVLEAALLLEANWHENLHQVWVTLVPEAEAIKRLKERNNFSEDEARLRIASQMSNYDRVQSANVVFCSLWDYEFTRQQVAKAWQMLETRNYID